MGKVCCFTGHREFFDEKSLLSATLNKLLRSLVKRGFDTFRVGGAVGFDMLAADEVLEMKKEFPDIKLHIFVPCLTQNKYYTKEQNKRYLEQINAADKIMCISEQYNSGCMQKRNRALVDGADFCVAYLRHHGGGTDYTVRYAEKNGVYVERL